MVGILVTILVISTDELWTLQTLLVSEHSIRQIDHVDLVLFYDAIPFLYKNYD